MRLDTEAKRTLTSIVGEGLLEEYLQLRGTQRPTAVYCNARRALLRKIQAGLTSCKREEEAAVWRLFRTRVLKELGK